jgi:hypothetical protein
MCDEREPYRDTRSDDEQALEEIRRLFDRYRGAARHGVVTERHETPHAPAEERDAAATPAGR